jgi:hypothetical protein
MKPINQMSADEYKAFLELDPTEAERQATANQSNVGYVDGAFVKADGTAVQPVANQPQQSAGQARVYRNGAYVESGPSVAFWKNGKLVSGGITGGPGGKENTRPLI